MNDQQTQISDIETEKPPVLSSWLQLYAVVFLNLVVLVVLFYWFTRFFS